MGRVIDELGLPSTLANPYYIAFKAMVNVTAQHQARMGFSEPIDFIFDDQSEKGVICAAWEDYVASVPADIRALTGHAPLFSSDVDTMPLQAADLYAWWIRRWWLEKGTTLLDAQPFPWSVGRDMPRLVMEFTEDNLRSGVRKVRELMDGASPADWAHPSRR